MKKYNQLFAAFLLLISPMTQAKTHLTTDVNPERSLPKRYRVIEPLHIIGSGQFNRTQLQKTQNQVKGPIVIVDLRQESHGFIDDMPISWYQNKNWINLNKSSSMIDDEENKLIQDLATQKKVTAHLILSRDKLDKIKTTKPYELKPKQIYTEAQLAKSLGMGYKRFHVSDHSAPSPSQVHEFERFLQTLPQDTWLYFHCRGGSGRTTTFMALYAIQHQAHQKSLEAIIKDQFEAGGRDLAKLPAPDHYKYHLAVKRYETIKKYYAHILHHSSVVAMIELN